MYEPDEQDIKKLKNKNWRLNNLYWIKDKNQKKVKFKQNRFQKQITEEKSKRDEVLKARQLGISTGYLIDYLDDTIFKPNTTTAILSHKQDSMRKLFTIIRRAYKYMDAEVQPIIDKGGGSSYELRFPEIDSKIYTTMEAVSDTINNLHISEFGLMDTDERVKTSLDAVTIDGRVSIESTPRGFNHFYDHWIDDNGFKKFFFPWYLDPYYQLDCNKKDVLPYTENEFELIKKAKLNYNFDISHKQIAWRRAKIKEKGRGGYENFLQEYPEDDQTCFLTSGDAVFDGMTIAELKKKVRPVIREWEGFKIYEEYDSSKRYVIGADVAEGISSDYSVAKVLRVDNREEVASFRANRIKPGDFGVKLQDVAKLYHTGGRPKPLIGVERNNHGHAVLLRLDTDSYENIFHHDDNRAGWKTSTLTRPIMLDTFIEAVEDGFCRINDVITLNECLTLVDNKGKIEAAEGKHDDTIIAHAIALQMAIVESGSAMLDNIGDMIDVG
jgi:hypothetical protein